MSMVRKVLTAGMAVALSVSMAVAASAAERKPKPPKKMVINGISSGVLRVPEVAVWSCPGGAMGGCVLEGQIKHGTEVTRFEYEKVRGLKWYRIKGPGIEGWVISDFLAMPK